MARRAAKEDADLAAMIDAEIERIDSDAETQRAAIGSIIYDLKLPALNTVIRQVEAKPEVKQRDAQRAWRRWRRVQRRSQMQQRRWLRSRRLRRRESSKEPGAPGPLPNALIHRRPRLRDYHRRAQATGAHARGRAQVPHAGVG